VAFLGITGHRRRIDVSTDRRITGGRLILQFRRARNENPPGETPALSGDRLLLATMQSAGRWLVPLVVVAVLGAVATLALPAVLGHALDEIVAAARSDTASGPDVGGPLLVTAGLVVLVVVADVVANLVAGAATAESTGLLRREVAGHVLAAGPAMVDGNAEGDVVARLVANTTTAAKSVVVASGLAAATLPPVGAVVALGLIDPWLALTFAVGMVSASGAVRTYLRDSRKATAGYLEAQGAIAARLVDALAGARSIAAARTTDREVERVRAPLDAVRRHGAEVWRNIARLAFQGEPVVLLTQAAVIGVAGVGVAAGRLTPGEMLAASRYAVMAAGISGILDELAALTRARAGADRIVELLGVPIVRYGGRRLPPGPGALELRAVTAGAEGAEGADGRPVLRGLDLVVPGGRTVALVGRSGGGKSLVAALAGRLCDPQEGEVLLDGVPLPALDRRTLRRAVTYAFERPELLGETIGAAIGFGVDQPSPSRIRAAAEAARADPFIVRLPDGYDAVLARTPLSGGEIQRLGLARALAHEARLVILDDATSSLDTATEAQIAAALTATMEGRTRLIVTHRLATAARADLVAWLDGGSVRACAPHRDLWSDPAYRAIFRPSPAPVAAASERQVVVRPHEAGDVAEPAPDLRPEPDDEREDGPPPASAPPGQPEVPSEDEIAASAVAATANDPLAVVDGRAVVPLAAGGGA
jgi:ATP-binding cassette subfamily B protein